ncbi:MAG: type II toxin-antitoxin system VapC family toxin [Candidatus Bathyarchaeia archaeon]
MKRDLYYVDSNVFIYSVIYDEVFVPEARKCREFLLKIALGEIEAHTSLITWDEVTWIVKKIMGEELSVEYGRKFLRFPNLRFLGVKRTTILKAQDFMEKYRLKPRDAIHAATALENKINIIVSYDRDFDSLIEVKRTEP